MSAPQRPGLAGLDQIGQLPGYGQFTGYAPVPGAQGAYLFDLVNGGKVPFSGAPAEDLRTKIDAARGYQPGDAARAFGGGASPGQAPAAPAQSNKFDPLVSTKGGGELGVRSGGDPANPMDYVVRTPGRAATKGGMAARGMTSQGGYNLDPQFIEDMDRSNQETQAITTQAVKEGAQLAAKKQAYFERLQAQTENEAAVAAHENAVKQQRFGEMQAKLDKAEQDYINTPAEQEAARNTPKAKLATFLGALSSAFGALGASLARTPNFAAEAIARHNEMQIRREEAELRVKKDTKDSMLGQLQQQLGSMELARSAYRSILAKQSALGLEALAQKEGDQQRQRRSCRRQNFNKGRRSKSVRRTTVAPKARSLGRSSMCLASPDRAAVTERRRSTSCKGSRVFAKARWRLTRRGRRRRAARAQSEKFRTNGPRRSKRWSGQSTRPTASKRILLTAARALTTRWTIRSRAASTRSGAGQVRSSAETEQRPTRSSRQTRSRSLAAFSRASARATTTPS
jgi:hypothetical protein